MSKSLVTRNDAGSSVVSEVGHDFVTAGITVATVVAYSLLPIFAWVAPVAGGGYLLLRAYKRGRNKAKR